MNPLEVFKLLAIAPTDDYNEFRKAYVIKLKKLQSKSNKVRGTEEFNEVEDKILELNQAFNVINKRNIKDMKRKAEAMKNQEGIPKELRDMLEDDYDGEDLSKGLDNIQTILDSIEIKWEDKDLDSIEETITLNDFMNGSYLLTDSNETIEIPSGFLGVMTTIVDNKLRFVNIRGKDSVTFAYSPTGNLLLKALPDDAVLNNKEGFIKFKLRNNKFNIDLNRLKWSKEHKVWIGHGQGLKPYGEDKKGDILIDLNNVKCKDKELLKGFKETVERKGK